MYHVTIKVAYQVTESFFFKIYGHNNPRNEIASKYTISFIKANLHHIFDVIQLLKTNEMSNVKKVSSIISRILKLHLVNTNIV